MIRGLFTSCLFRSELLVLDIEGYRIRKHLKRFYQNYILKCEVNSAFAKRVSVGILGF